MCFELTDNFIIKYKLDDFALLFVILISVMYIVIGIYSIGYFKHDNKKKLFFGLYPLSYLTLIGVATAGNLITMYITFELMTLITLPFILYEKDEDAIKGGFKFLFFSIGGTFMALAGIYLLYAKIGGSFDFTNGHILAEVFEQNKEVILVASMLIIVGFGTKAGMVPMHGWLTTAHPVAPSPASAMLSGIVVKCGVITIVRSIFYIIGVENLKGTWVQYTWITLSLITIFMGSMLAYKEKIFKKRLAYSTISQMSYIMLGLSLMNVPGFIGGMIHVVIHSAVKALLFLTAGVIIHQTGKKDINDFDGLGKSMPITFWCYTIASITLVGIPPAATFVSKWYLCVSALAFPTKLVSYIAIGVLMISALLTAGYLFPIFIRGFVPRDEYKKQEYPRLEPGKNMLFALIILTIAILVTGIYPNYIINFVANIVTELI